jgi:hypothetical protein
MIQHINRIMDKNQHLFMIKALKKLGMEGSSLNIIKVIYHKLISNIILNGEKLKALPLKSGMRQASTPFIIIQYSA